MAKQVQVPGFGSLQLLAPAVRVDNFRSAILSLVDQDIRRVTVYTMNTAAENADSCFRFYRHSLLYLISRRFEPERMRRFSAWSNRSARSGPGCRVRI